ncbi:30S ribosomal protein S2 [Patescibacteria group bacterium]|nr:30S ribosomal protein S2 [Patescibacteria group bacterium]MBU1663187.1 30S ribosomal protein S2 [Patescibacteria group bacterium]MBU1934307.1 30S ribosomal protein S2 [Patescibacteria group bacterium]MBU2007888.1 30S ribosomal protein S2 [Patescibacteria group bacterium]MBU2233674.1 30S ribosomal protein S2 [Patescibacteria group bacterium]
MMTIPSIEDMLKAGMHFGHRTSKWHPKMKLFIFGSKKGVHIIDLRKTQKMLGMALEYIKRQSAEGKAILLVGTKMQVKNILKKTAEETGMPYVSSKWLGGFLTNFPIIKNLIRKFKDLSEKRAGGKLDKYTKKERLDFDRQIAKLETNVGGLVSLTKIPDVIFIWDIKKEKTAFTEALKKKIPVVAVCDTNVNPDGVKYIIPANDDASKGIKLVMNLIKEAILEGKAESQNKENK